MTLFEQLQQMSPADRSAAYAALTDTQKAQVHAERQAMSTPKAPEAPAATAPPDGLSPAQARLAEARKAKAEADAALAAAIEQRDSTAAQNTGFAQGLTFNQSEEIGSLTRHLPQWVTGSDETPQQYRDRKRAEQDFLSETQGGDYMGGEIAGAIVGTIVPGVGWVSGPARGAKAATALGRLATTAGRGAIVGGADAGLRGLGGAEGDLAARAPEAVRAIPGGAAFGAALGPVAETIAEPILRGLTAKFGRTATLAVERNVREIAAKTGMSTDEVLRRVAAGQPLAGLNDTTRMAARAIKNLDPVAGQNMIEATGPRLESAVQGAVGDVKTALVGPRLAAAPNLRETALGEIGATRTATGEALGAARLAAGDAQTSGTLMAALDAASRSPNIASDINSTLRLKGLPPLFKNTPQGMTLLRQPSILEAEIITRELGDMASSAYQGAGGIVSTTRGEALNELSTGLRRAVDAEAPQLGPLREANSAAIAAEKDAFPLGLVSRSTAPDKFSMEFGALPDAAKDATRMGAAVRIGEDVGKNRRDTSLIDEMMNPGRYLGGNIDTLAPNAVNRAPGSPLAIAQDEGRLMDALTGNSTTAGQQQAMANLQGVPGIRPVSEIGLTNPLMKLADIVQKTLGAQTGLDEAGLRSLAQIMMQSGPEGQAILQKILNGSPLLRGETVSLGRMARAAAGVGAASVAQPAQDARTGIATGAQSLLDMMGGPQ